MSKFLQLGVQAAQARKPAEALTWFQRAHEADRTDPVARAWLGQSLCSLGRRVEGLVHLSAAGRQLLETASRSQTVPKDTTKVFEVLGQLQFWGAFESALDLARDLARIDPANPRAHQMLAVTCGQINLTSEALTAVREAVRLAPDHAMLQVLHGSLEADAKLYAPARSRLEALLAKGVPAREAFRAHKELARVLDATGEHDGVFAHLEAAAALALTLPEYSQQDPRVIPERIRQNRAGFTRELMGRFSGQAFPDQPRAPVFLMGFFRSGTTLTQEVLDAHPDVFVADEASLLWAMEQELHRIDPGPASVPDKLARLGHTGATRLRAAYWSAAHGRYGAKADGTVFVDKYTLNTVDVGLINTVFPDARVLFVMRDPRDVCLSCVMQLMVPSPATRHLLTLQDTTALYALVLRWWIDVKGQLTVPALEFRYEDAIGAFEPTFRRVFEFLGLAWHPEVVNFHKGAAGKFIASPSRNQVAQPLYASSVARWRRYQTALSLVSEVLAPFVAHFGYPAD